MGTAQAPTRWRRTSISPIQEGCSSERWWGDLGVSPQAICKNWVLQTISQFFWNLRTFVFCQFVFMSIYFILTQLSPESKWTLLKFCLLFITHSKANFVYPPFKGECAELFVSWQALAPAENTPWVASCACMTLMGLRSSEKTKSHLAVRELASL